MRLVILWVVIALAIILVVTGIVAVFRGKKEGSATIKVFGLEISGVGGAVLLVVGVVLLFASWSWNEDRMTKTAAVSDLERASRDLSSLYTKVDRLRASGGRNSTIATMLLSRDSTEFRYSPRVERELFESGRVSMLPMRFFSDTAAYTAEVQEEELQSPTRERGM